MRMASHLAAGDAFSVPLTGLHYDRRSPLGRNCAVILKMIARSIGFAAVLALLLFVPAGTLAWTQGWIFLALFMCSSLIIGLWLAKVDPGLLAARMKSPLSREQRSSDRAVMAGIMIIFYAWVVFMPLDARRFGWSHVPLWAQVLGGVLIVSAFLGWIAVLKANSFAAVTIGVQQERGHTVISTGPYAIVRHPMYAFLLPLMIGTALLLGSLWGLLGVLLMLPLLAARATGEEAVLRDGLPGYREYSTKVRFRLVPGVW
jgi:protein-S-isoprenylcysteine O-methyltransferase Ste14